MFSGASDPNTLRMLEAICFMHLRRLPDYHPFREESCADLVEQGYGNACWNILNDVRNIIATGNKPEDLWPHPLTVAAKIAIMETPSDMDAYLAKLPPFMLELDPIEIAILARRAYFTQTAGRDTNVPG